MAAGPNLLLIIQNLVPIVLQLCAIAYVLMRYRDHRRAATWGIIGLTLMLSTSLIWLVGGQFIGQLVADDVATSFALLSILSSLIHFGGVCCLIRGLLMDRRMSALKDFRGQITADDNNPYAAPMTNE